MYYTYLIYTLKQGEDIMIDFASEARKYREEFINLLDQWISIPSLYNAESVSVDMPFGKNVNEALKWFEDLGTGEGFNTKFVDGYATHIEYGEGAEYVYAFGHCDVVPPGDGWTCNPFKLLKSGDNLIGRGVIDDKGPLLACFIALKLIRDNNLTLKRKIRIVAGGNEESGFRCIKHYFKNEPRPTYGFTPDAKFPVINGEKGATVITINGNINSGSIEISGGEVHNTIPNYVVVKGCNIEHKLKDIKNLVDKENLSLEFTQDKNIIPSFKLIGIGGHSSKPEKANNPIEKVFRLLNMVLKEDGTQELDSLFGGNNRLGQLFGLDLGGRCGVLTIVPTIILVEKERLSLTLSVRYPENLTATIIVEKICSCLQQHGLNKFEVKCISDKKPHYIEEDSLLVKKLYQIYLKHTGDTENAVRVTSAGTYAAEMINSVVFGGEFPGGASGNAHMAGEHGSEEEFIKSIGIYAEALYELCTL